MLRRISRVEADNIGAAGLERLLSSVVEEEGSEVKSLSVEGDLSPLPPQLLSQLLPRLESLNLERARLSEEQLEVMLTSLRDQEDQLVLTTLSLQASLGSPQLFTALDSQLLRKDSLCLCNYLQLKTISNSTRAQSERLFQLCPTKTGVCESVGELSDWRADQSVVPRHLRDQPAEAAETQHQRERRVQGGGEPSGEVRGETG